MITEKEFCMLVKAGAVARVDVVRLGSGSTRGYQIDVHGRHVDVLGTARREVRVFRSLDTAISKILALGWVGNVQVVIS